MKKILIFLIVFFVFANIATLSNNHNWGGDFSAYIGQSKAIFDGKVTDFSSTANFRVSFSEAQVGPNLYPWGYPLILVPVIGLLGVNIVALKFVTYLFFIGSLIVLYYLFKDRLTKEISLLVVLIMAASPYFFEFKQNVLSDVPAMFFLLLSAFLIQTIYLKKTDFRSKNIYLILLGFSIFISFFIRTSSFTLLPLLFLIQAIEYKKWFNNSRDLLLSSIPYLIFLVGYLLTSLMLPAGSYAANHALFNSDFFKLAIGNLYYYAIVLADFFGSPAGISGLLGTGMFPVFQILYAINIFLFLVGFFKSWRKNYFYALFFLINLSLFLIYQYIQGLRFIIPLIPFYLFFVIIGIKTLNPKRFLKISSQKFVYAFGFLLTLFFAVQIYPLAGIAPAIDGPYSADSQGLFNFIKKNTASTESIAFFKPRVMYLITGRKSLYIGTADFLKQSKVTDYYAYTNDVDRKNMEDYLSQNGQLIFQNDKFRVYDLR